jgi:alpha-mannosidase
MSKTLEKRFHELRGRIEGFRAKRRYETNYFIPLEEELGCVPVNRWHLRILSELEFCLQMKAHMGTDVTAPVDAALTILEEAGRTDGALPDSICAQAENCLLPLAPEAKTYHLIMAGHSHIDMNWKWSWDETVATTIATFKTMLKLMEEYPDYHFSQSQAATYKIIEDYAAEHGITLESSIDGWSQEQMKAFIEDNNVKQIIIRRQILGYRNRAH